MRATLKSLLLLSCFLVLVSLRAKAAADCSISTAGVAFGNYDSLGSGHRDTIGTITVTCTGNQGDTVSYALLLDATGQQGAYRAMTNGIDQLNYLIYSNSGYTQVWGDGTGGSTVVSDSYRLQAGSNSHTYPMYGSIPSGQHHIAAGSYGGNITITLAY